jgi:UPF0271 protein
LLNIDLNADVGEGAPAEAALLPYVTSLNVACGFHAGGPAEMDRAVNEAARLGLAVGAHPGYPDREGFGRRRLGLSPEEVYRDVLYQLGALAAFGRAAGVGLTHLKPHGAMYAAAGTDPALAAGVVRAAKAFGGLAIMAPPGSALLAAAAAAGLPFIREGFADRAYLPDGRLVPRDEPGAVLAEPARVAQQAQDLSLRRGVTAAGGAWLSLEVDTICVHADTYGAVAIVRAVRASLEEAGVQVRAGCLPLP